MGFVAFPTGFLPNRDCRIMAGTWLTQSGFHRIDDCQNFNPLKNSLDYFLLL